MADLLVSEPARPEIARRRRARLTLLLVLLVAVLAAAAVDRWERQRQLDRLLDAAGATEQVIRDSRRSLSGLVQYSSALLARPDLAPEQRAAVLDSLAMDASRYPPRVTRLRRAVEQVRPLPWDGELARARTAYLERIDAWTSFVARAQEQPDTLLLEHRTTRPAREAAAEALLAAADGRSPDQLDDVRAALLRR